MSTFVTKKQYEKLKLAKNQFQYRFLKNNQLLKSARKPPKSSRFHYIRDRNDNSLLFEEYQKIKTNQDINLNKHNIPLNSVNKSLMNSFKKLEISEKKVAKMKKEQKDNQQLFQSFKKVALNHPNNYSCYDEILEQYEKKYNHPVYEEILQQKNKDYCISHSLILSDVYNTKTDLNIMYNAGKYFNKFREKYKKDIKNQTPREHIVDYDQLKDIKFLKKLEMLCSNKKDEIEYKNQKDLLNLRISMKLLNYKASYFPKKTEKENLKEIEKENNKNNNKNKIDLTAEIEKQKEEIEQTKQSIKLANLEYKGRLRSVSVRQKMVTNKISLMRDKMNDTNFIRKEHSNLSKFFLSEDPQKNLFKNKIDRIKKINAMILSKKTVKSTNNSSQGKSFEDSSLIFNNKNQNDSETILNNENCYDMIKKESQPVSNETIRKIEDYYMSKGVDIYEIKKNIREKSMYQFLGKVKSIVDKEKFQHEDDLSSSSIDQTILYRKKKDIKEIKKLNNKIDELTKQYLLTLLKVKS